MQQKRACADRRGNVEAVDEIKWGGIDILTYKPVLSLLQRFVSLQLDVDGSSILVYVGTKYLSQTW